MQLRGLPFTFQLAVAVCLGFIAAAVPAWGSTEFTITATNVTMPASGGTGATQYTVTEIPNTGTLTVTCQYSGPATEANLPTCTYGPVRAPEPVNAGQTVTGTIFFYPYGSAIPADRQRTNPRPSTALAFAGALLLGFGFRRRRRGLLLVVLALATLAATMGLSACTGALNAMTPGTYQYTLQAGNVGSLNNLAAGASTNISVTVP
jgi:hypothetical protein